MHTYGLPRRRTKAKTAKPTKVTASAAAKAMATAVALPSFTKSEASADGRFSGSGARANGLKMAAPAEPSSLLPGVMSATVFPGVGSSRAAASLAKFPSGTPPASSTAATHGAGAHSAAPTGAAHAVNEANATIRTDGTKVLCGMPSFACAPGRARRNDCLPRAQHLQERCETAHLQHVTKQTLTYK